MYIGPHLTISKGFTYAINTALDIGASTFQFFSRNPRGSRAKDFNPKDIHCFQEIRKKEQIGPIMAHAPYTLNLASPKDSVYDFSKQILKEDLKRMDSINIPYLNIHPGSSIDLGIDVGISKIIEGINYAIYPEQNVLLLLETMSGKGSEIGYRFEHLKQIMDGISLVDKIGVCMDICHVFAAGYDIVNHLDEVLLEFDRIIGLSNLKAIHLNDSVMPFASKKDRHCAIGTGEIGLAAIKQIINHPLLKNLPFYLETPLDDEGHKAEIELIRKNCNL